MPAALRQQVQIFSASIALCGDLSGRMVSILRDQFARVEVYYIDESFMDFQGIRAERREQVAA